MKAISIFVDKRWKSTGIKTYSDFDELDYVDKLNILEESIGQLTKLYNITKFANKQEVPNE